MKPQTPVQRARVKMFNGIYRLSQEGDPTRWLWIDGEMRRAIKAYTRAIRAEERKQR